MPRRVQLFGAVLAVVVALDQVTKAWARASLPGRAPVRVIGEAFTLRLACNTSTAFNLFPDVTGARILLSIIGVGAFVVIAVMMWRAGERGVAFPSILALLGAGALGNAIDRIHAGCVTDFVVWRAGDYIWPAFNVADAALVCGVLLLLILGWITGRAQRSD